MMDWVLRMKPAASMLKFRLPFFMETNEQIASFYEKASHSPFAKESFDNTQSIVDFREMLRTRQYRFFSGEILLQPWAPRSSTETRLILVGDPAKIPLRDYSLSEYEDHFYYFNKILRNYQMYENSNADRNIGFDHCADCALENVIWVNYCRAYHPDLAVHDDTCRHQVHDYVVTLGKLTYRPLNMKGHGRFFGPIPLHILQRNIDNYDKKD
jgi:hypothetical protein